MQTIIITGRVGADAELRQAGSSEVCGFTVAVDQGFGERKTTNWFKCQMWGARGKSVQPYILKGSNVTVSGELETSEYNGKLQLGIRVNEVQLPPKPQGSGNGGSGHQREPSRGGGFVGDHGGGAWGSDLDEDTPF